MRHFGYLLNISHSFRSWLVIVHGISNALALIFEDLTQEYFGIMGRIRNFYFD